MHLRSPAKINLFLRVLGKRSDQFHELASLFQAISLFDEFSLTPSAHDSFECTDPSLPLDARNLVIKARDLFREKTGCYDPVKIVLCKKIPSEAGLGGGSGNAATALYGLNALFGAGRQEAELAQWGASLGSDVPFFFSSGRAFCTGRGEAVEAAGGQTAPQLTLIKPSQGLSTKEVYGRFNQESASKEDPRLLLKSHESGRGIYINDLEMPAFKASPSLEQLKTAISHYLPHVLLSGSGSCFFAEGALSESARKSLQAESYGLQFFEVAPVTRTSVSWY